jgi:hypothetical protein
MAKSKNNFSKKFLKYYIGFFLFVYLSSTDISPSDKGAILLMLIGYFIYRYRSFLYQKVIYIMKKLFHTAFSPVYNIEDIDQMTGIEFEECLHQLFISLGFFSNKTPTSGDFGADLIINKAGKKICVQAKRYNKNIGVKAVQEVAAALTYYKATEGWVITNQDFTKPAYQLAKTNNITLINRKKLIKMIKQASTPEKIRLFT